MDILGQIDSKIVIGAISGCYMAVFAVYVWIGRTKVNHKLCDTVQKNNYQEHENIRQWIDDAEKRAEGRHSELREDLKEVKGLIKNNGKDRGRVFT